MLFRKTCCKLRNSKKVSNAAWHFIQLQTANKYVCDFASKICAVAENTAKNFSGLFFCPALYIHKAVTVAAAVVVKSQRVCRCLTVFRHWRKSRDSRIITIEWHEIRRHAARQHANSQDIDAIDIGVTWYDVKLTSLLNFIHQHVQLLQ